MKQPLLMIAGTTASGKTALGIALARRYDGEIVSADSMQVYRGMEIATAKPTVGERCGIPHHMMDFLPPTERFSLADYLAGARRAITEIAHRGRLPIVVGGTGLYISALADHLQLPEIAEYDPALRDALQKRYDAEGGEVLLQELRAIDPPLADRLHPNNRTRILRGLEIYRLTGRTMTDWQIESRSAPSPYRLCMLGLTCRDREKLYRRIDRRVDAMVEQGLFAEAEAYLSRQDMTTAAQAIGYKELAGYFRGEKSREEAIADLKRETRHYAKRQLTWFRRDKRIHWLFLDEWESLTALEQEAAAIVTASGIL